MHSLLEKIDRGQIWSFSGGIHPPEQKALSNHKVIGNLPLSPTLVLPLKQHIGGPGQLLVAVGDKVAKGQPLTKAGNAMSVPIHAPSSGVVSAIEPRPVLHPSGLPELCIVIDTDGEQRWHPRQPLPLDAPVDNEQIRKRIAAAGISGMGGATFPTSVKLSTRKPIEYLIINGAECEPYITADDRLMRDHAQQILVGITLLQRLLNPKRVIIAIEDNKPEAIAAMEQSLAQQGMANVLVRAIPTKYPSGSEKQLIQIVTGMQVMKGQLPADLGILMQNIGTCFAIKRAVYDDEPLIERVVTVTGEQANNAGNYWVPLGTPVEWLLSQTKTDAIAGQPLIIGGPMMGFALHNPTAGVTKGTNCVIAPSRQEMPPAQPARSCIRCGECAQACPQQLLPQQLFWHAQAGENDKAEKLNLFDCIECGACAFVCPSDIPLVQHYRIAKAAIRNERAAAEKAAAAKVRFEARQARLEKEKLERENRHKRAATKKPDAAPSAAVAAAIAKLKADKAAQEPATDAQTDMAELRRQRKAQARAAKQQAAEAATATDSQDTATVSPSDKPKPAAVAAAIAKAKAKQAAQSDANKADGDETSRSTAKPKSAAVAAAIAKAKAKQAATKAQAEDVSSNSDADKAADSATKPKSAAVAAAIAKAKAKQAEAKAQANNASDNSHADKAADSAAKPKSAAVAAAIAKAKAKQAAAKAQANNASDNSEAEKAADSAAKPKSAAVAAAIAKAKAKQAAAKAQANNASDNSEAERAADSVAKPKSAAVAAAIAKAKAKQAAAKAQPDQASSKESEQPAKPASKPKSAAVAAAIAKAKAKKAAEQAKKENN